MTIRQRLVLYFSMTTIFLVGLSMFFIYSLFADYRKEEYQDRLRDKIVITLKFLAEVEQLDHNMLQQIDKFSINNLYTENLLLFDSKKQLIYSGIDDTRIIFANNVLNNLSKRRQLIETREGEYDVVGAYVVYNDRVFYGITKAYDTFGIAKLDYLKYVLLLSFFGISVVILLISNYLARRISRPLDTMSMEIGSIKLGTENTRISVPNSKDEINYLAKKFNELMDNLENAFSFQKHAIHHISHELKTPIAILVSNFDRIETEPDTEKQKALLANQKQDTKSLGDIINALLEISKVESGSTSLFSPIRIDELLFDVLAELKIIHEDFDFHVDIASDFTSESSFTVNANPRLMKSVLSNLALNCIKYSSSRVSTIRLFHQEEQLCIEFMNPGTPIQPEEVPYLFQHFFRGHNSTGKRGFGLGLVLIQRILQLHNGTVNYRISQSGENIFGICLP